jgi:integrase
MSSSALAQTIRVPPVTRITTDTSRDFAEKRQADGVGTAMVNRSLSCLRRMLRIAHEDNKLQFIPKIRLLKEPPARKGFLEQEKFEELIALLPTHLRPLVTFLYYCGVRVNEARQIEWKQVNLGARLIRLEEEQTKTEEARVVPLPSLLVAMLRDVEPKSGRVFSDLNLRTEWEKACAACGLGKRTKVEPENNDGYAWYKYKGLLLHDLRRSAVRNLRKAGVPETVIMKITGHKTAEVFRRYNIVSTDDVSAAMRSLELKGSSDSSVIVSSKSNRRLRSSRSK